MRLLGALTGLMLLGVFANASPTTSSESEDTIDGMEIVEAEWDLELTPGGEVVHLTGTVEEIYPQLLELNPTYETDWAGHNETNAEDENYIIEDEEEEEEEETESENPASVLSKRTTFLSSKIKCSVATWASCYYIKKGISYLRKVSGKPGNAAGKCGRVSCSYNSGIYWCNTGSSYKTLNSFGSIADGAQATYKKCYDPDGQFCWVRGRATHTTNWYVLVRGVSFC